MKKVIFILAGFIISFSSYAYGSDWRPYIGIGAQASIATASVENPDNSVWGSETATIFGGVYDFSVGLKRDRFRMEVNYFNRVSVNDTISWFVAGVVTSTSEQGMLLNLYYDYVSGDFFSMYAGFGAGFSSWKQSVRNIYFADYNFDRSGTDFCFALYLLNMSFSMDPISVDLGLLNWQHTGGINLNGVNFRLGMRYTF